MTTTTLRDARVLVTGASGFIGRRLVAQLSRQGATVAAISRRVSFEATNADNEVDGSAPRRPGRVRWHHVDLTRAKSVAALLERVRPELVVHLASLVTGQRERAMVLPTFHANLASSVYLLDAAADRGVRRLVMAGSLEEPDVAGAAPASPYAAAKAAASSYAAMYHNLYGAPVVVARLFMVYGPGQQDPNKLMPYVLRCAATGESPRLSSGNREVDWVFIDDVVEGLERLLVQPGLEGLRVDLGSGRLVAVREVVLRLLALAGGTVAPVFGALAERPFEQVRVADLETTRHLLSWVPATPLEEGLERTVRAAREGGC